MFCPTGKRGGPKKDISNCSTASQPHPTWMELCTCGFLLFRRDDTNAQIIRMLGRAAKRLSPLVGLGWCAKKGERPARQETPANKKRPPRNSPPSQLCSCHRAHDKIFLVLRLATAADQPSATLQRNRTTIPRKESEISPSSSPSCEEPFATQPLSSLLITLIVYVQFLITQAAHPSVNVVKTSCPVPSGTSSALSFHDCLSCQLLTPCRCSSSRRKSSCQPSRPPALPSIPVLEHT